MGRQTSFPALVGELSKLKSGCMRELGSCFVSLCAEVHS